MYCKLAGGICVTLKYTVWHLYNIVGGEGGRGNDSYGLPGRDLRNLEIYGVATNDASTRFSTPMLCN